MLLQEFYAKQACDEIGLKNPNIKINHSNGITIVNGETYGIVFPKSLINYCKNLWSDRKNKYYFKGIIKKNRQWIKNYSNVHESNRGRNKNLKYTLDKDYYKSLAQTQFSLSPIGECPWSYRFFESVACGAIPILGDKDVDLFAKDYKFFRHSDCKVYDTKDANYNFEILLEKVTLKNEYK